jgi:hypothetical protein
MPQWDLGLRATWENEDAKALQALDELKNLNNEVAKSQQTHQAASAAADEHGNALSGLGAKAAGLVAQFVGIAAAVKFAWDSFKDAVTADKLMTQLTANARMLGGATEEQIRSLPAWVREISVAGGVMKEQLIPAVTTLMAATHDLTSAQLLAEVATGAAARGIGDFEGNVGALARAMETGTLRGFSPFVQMLREMLKGGEDINKVLPELVKRFGDAGAAVDTVAMQLARQKIMWVESKEEMGRAMEGISSAGVPILKGLAFALGLVGGGVLKVIGVFASLPAAMRGHFAEAAAIQKEWSEKATRMLEGVVDAWQKPADAAKRSEQEQGDALKRLAALFREHQKKEKAEADTELSEATRNIEKSEELRLHLEEQRRKKRLREILADKAEEERIEKEGDKKIEAFGNALFNAGEQLSAKQLEHLVARMRKALAEEQMTDQQRLQLKKQVAAAESQLDLAVADLKVKTDLEALSMLGQAAVTAFEGNKAVAVADAIISTYVAASHAAETKPFLPLGLAMTILALAQGFARVKQIESTSVGTGGGGVGAAASPSVAVPPSVYTGPSAAPVSSTHVESTVNQPSNITINTLTGDGAVATARQVRRILAPGERAYMRGIVNRAATTVGSRR